MMGRLERGTELLRALRRVCADNGVRCGEIRALGALENVEVCTYDQKGRKYGPARTYRGDLEILAAVGNVSERQGDLALHLHITVARDTDNGIEVLGGHLLSGKVFACEFVIHAFDDLIMRRGHDKATGLPLWQDKIEFSPGEAGETKGPAAEGESPSAEPPGPGSSAAEPGGAKLEVSRSPADEPTWKEVMQAALGASSPSAGAETAAPKDGPADSTSAAEDEPADWVEPQAGDLIEHPTFGLVTVERSEEGDFLHVRLQNGRLVRLSLDVLELKLVGHERGHQLFQATVVGH